VELWAAIDLLGGSVVTLKQGKEDRRTTWEQGAAELAARWENEGADGVHIIDLDAALGKKGGSNLDTILPLVERAGVPVQVGGGIRSRESAEALLRAGVFRVILGTVAYAEPETLAGLLESYGPERIVVAADYSSEGKVMTRGWTSSQDFSVFEAAKMMESKGVRNLLVTAVGQDGMAGGPDAKTMKELCASSSLAMAQRSGGGDSGRMKIYGSGGIRDVADIQELAEAGASGVIVGRALYDGGVNLAVAKAALEGGEKSGRGRRAESTTTTNIDGGEEANRG
jgi:phosphoribosylformimino-5-aminoimidazole carboxamide ribotide isomerase